MRAVFKEHDSRFSTPFGSFLSHKFLKSKTLKPLCVTQTIFVGTTWGIPGGCKQEVVKLLQREPFFEIFSRRIWRPKHHTWWGGTIHKSLSTPKYTSRGRDDNPNTRRRELYTNNDAAAGTTSASLSHQTQQSVPLEQ